jgi:cytochrome c oxidase subunit II
VRKGALVRLAVVGLVAGAAAVAVALFVPWLPETASEERDRIDVVFWVATGICIFVFAIVAGVSLYAVWKFRARPDDYTDGPPIHGHTGLEILWTAVPTVLVIAIATVSAVALAKNDSLPDDRLVVNVTARQFAWSFAYPDLGDVTSAQLRLPLNRPVELRIRSLDVIHSFWVPEFGQKQDALPELKPDEYPAHLKITPTKLGKFPVICTELCGAGHALMRSFAIVMEPGAFQNWASGQQQQQTSGNAGTAGAAVFKEQGCGSCHTFEPANATAKVGPDLDKLAQYARAAGKEEKAFIRESIVNPGAYVEKGFPANTMPPFSSLPARQLDALVQYLAGSK